MINHKTVPVTNSNKHFKVELNNMYIDIGANRDSGKL